MNIGFLAALALCLFPAGAFAQRSGDVGVMVLGTYHMGNPGRDLVNVPADDVTTPRRQQELDALVTVLADWKPDRILVEQERPASFTIPAYRKFTPGDLKSDRNEIVQIGYRLAHRLGHADVYGFDEQPKDGEPDYFPFDKVNAYADAHGQAGLVKDTMAFFQAKAAEQGAAQPERSVAELLLMYNDPEAVLADHARGYYGMLAIGGDQEQPGADLNAYWYMRNAKMFAKIGLIAKPGERVLVLVGAGHVFWLDHFARLTPGFTSVDPRPFLDKAAAAKR